MAAPSIDEYVLHAGILLQVRSEAVGNSLTVAQPLDQYRDMQGEPVRALGLAGEHQRINASLAIALTSAWEARCDTLPSNEGALGVVREQYTCRGCKHVAGRVARRCGQLCFPPASDHDQPVIVVAAVDCFAAF